jgi:hypothetical protein
MATSMQILAQASDNGGDAFVGVLMIIGIVWFVAYLCSPKKKGWDIDHKEQTTIKPR